MKTLTNLVININDIPEELAQIILDRIQQSIVSIIEEYGITGVYCDRKEERMIKIFEYPSDMVCSFDADKAEKTDSLWWDGTNFFYSYRGEKPQPYEKVRAKKDAEFYAATKQLWPSCLALCKQAGLIE